MSRASSLLVVVGLLIGMLPASSFAAVVQGGGAEAIPGTSLAATVTISGIATPSSPATAAPWVSTTTVNPVVEATVSVAGTITAISSVETTYGQSASLATSNTTHPTATPLTTQTLAGITAEGTTTIKYSATVATLTPLGTPTETTTQTAYVRIDRTAPNAPTVLSAVGPFNNIATPSFVATDAMSGIKSYEVTGTFGGVTNSTTSTAGSLTLTKAGAYDVNVVAVDNAGNRSLPTHVTFTINDTIAPVTTLVGNAPWLTKDTTLTLSAVDNTGGVGVANTFYSLNSESVYTTYTPAGFSIGTEGTTTVRFYSVDNSNNREGTETVLVHLDKTNPISTASGVPIGWVSINPTVTITAVDAISGVASVWTSLNNATPVSSVGATRVVTVSTEGTNTLTYGAVDVAGNHEATNTATVLLDKTKPVSSTDATAAGYSGTATIHISATDALSGVAGTSWGIDGGTLTSGTVAVSSLAGTHTLDYFSTDHAGNVEDTKHVTFHMTGGTAFSGLSSGGTVNYGAHGTVAGKLVDSLSATPTAGAIVTLQSSTNGVTFTTVATATTGASGSFSFQANLKSSNKTWFRVVFAGDVNHVAATSASVAFTPKVKVTTPATSSRLRSTVTLHFTAKVYPSHTSTSKSSTIAFERYKISGGVHVRRVRYYAKIVSHSGYSSLSRSFKLPKGTWYVRIYAKADSKHALTYSSAKKLVIK